MDESQNATICNRTRILPSFFYSKYSKNEPSECVNTLIPQHSTSEIKVECRDTSLRTSNQESSSSLPQNTSLVAQSEDHRTENEYNQYSSINLEVKVEIETEPNSINVHEDKSMNVKPEPLDEQTDPGKSISEVLTKIEETESDIKEITEPDSSILPVPQIANTRSLNDVLDKRSNEDEINRDITTFSSSLVPSVVTVTTQTNLRMACRYGQSCYRRNAQHKVDFSHPGDVDYQDSTSSSSTNSGNKPVCIYGSRCYRKNPDHIANFCHSMQTNHPKRDRRTVIHVDFSQDDSDELEDFGQSSDEDVYDSSFINDDDDEPSYSEASESDIPTPDQSDDEESKKRKKTAKKKVKKNKL